MTNLGICNRTLEELGRSELQELQGAWEHFSDYFTSIHFGECGVMSKILLER